MNSIPFRTSISECLRHKRLNAAAALLPVLAIAFGLSAAAGDAAAQSYPTHPITLVVPYTPGTGYDVIARAVGPKLGERLGQPIVVDNRPGASSLIGAGAAAKSDADGYTLVMIGEGTMAAVHLYANAKLNPLTDFSPITLAGYGTLMVVTNQQTGIKSMADLVARAKAQPDQMSYASPGVGTSQNIKMEQIKDVTGIQMLHVPYKGSAGALNDLMGNQVAVSLIPVHQAMPQVKAGKLVALAVIAPQRSPKAPDVPTLKEAGVNGVDSKMWYAFMAPKGTPAPIVKRLNSELKTLLATPDIKAVLEGVGIEVTASSPEQLQSLMQTESASSAEIIRKNHISMD